MPQTEGGEGVRVPIMIVGNKCDEENNREVKKELACKVVSESMKDSGHMETSAKLNLNVQQAFQVSPSEPTASGRPRAESEPFDFIQRP